jgi:hypothetical protein
VFLSRLESLSQRQSFNILYCRCLFMVLLVMRVDFTFRARIVDETAFGYMFHRIGYKNLYLDDTADFRFVKKTLI